MREQFHTDIDETTKTENVYELDENGDVIIPITIEKNESSFSLKVCSMLINTFPYFKSPNYVHCICKPIKFN